MIETETGFEVRICPQGHHNPPDFPACRVCQAELEEMDLAPGESINIQPGDVLELTNDYYLSFEA